MAFSTSLRSRGLSHRLVMLLPSDRPDCGRSPWCVLSARSTSLYFRRCPRSYVVQARLAIQPFGSDAVPSLEIWSVGLAIAHSPASYRGDARSVADLAMRLPRQ